MGEKVKKLASKVCEGWYTYLIVFVVFLFEDEIRAYLKPDLSDKTGLAMSMLSFIFDNSIYIPWILVPITFLGLLIKAYIDSSKESLGESKNNKIEIIFGSPFDIVLR